MKSLIAQFSTLKGTAILVSTLFIGGCFESSPLHESMEDMGDRYKTIKESDDLALIKKEYASLKSAFEIAKAQTVEPDAQATFKEGMDKTAKLMAQLEAAIAEGDLDTTKSLIKELGSTRKEYHDELGVK